MKASSYSLLNAPFANLSLSGPQAVKAAAGIRAARDKQEMWPFPWQEAPPGSKHVFEQGVIAAPPTAAQTLIHSYQVPNTYRFAFRSVVLWYSNSSQTFSPWVPGDGSVSFSLIVNNSTGAADASQGRPFKDYGTVLFPLGSPIEGAWPIDAGELSILESRNTLSAFVTVNPLQITSGFFTAIFKGWIWPNS